MAERSEVQIQSAFRGRVANYCPGVMVVAIPNGGRRGQFAMNQALREGMQPGFPDVLCFWRGGGVAAIEFKDAKGKCSAAQIEWINRLREFGVPAIVSRDPDHALGFLRECGAPFLCRAKAA